MPQPPRYDRDADFSKNHGSVQNGALLNSELDDIAQTVNALRDRQARLLNDDDSIKNGIIGTNQMTSQLKSSLDDAIANASDALAKSIVAENKADDANEKSNQAIEIANTADTNASEAVQTASLANANSENALTQAQTASATAESASTVVASVSALCDTAINTANSASTTAGEAFNSANSAVNTANDSLTVANEAKSIAESAEEIATASASSAQSAVDYANASAQSASNSESRVNTAIATIPSVVEAEVLEQVNDGLEPIIQNMVRQITPGIVDETVGAEYAKTTALNAESDARTSADNALGTRITNLDSSLKTVAKTGAYADLTGKPTIPTVPANVSALNNDSGYLTESTQIASTGSTSTRTLPDRFADVVNVKDFGAVGDGVTDDTTAINNALNTSTAKEIALYFPYGTYLVTGNLLKFYCAKKAGDGVIKKGTNLYYISPDKSQTNNLYVSVSGTGDGLSPTSPTTFEKAVVYVETEAVLDGYWNINLASGTYTDLSIIDNIKVVNANNGYNNAHGLNIIGATPSGAGANRTWGTKIQKGSNSSCLICSHVDAIRVKNIWFDSDKSTENTHGVYFMNSCGMVKVEDCYCTNAGGGGVAQQTCDYLEVYNSIIDGDPTGATKTGFGIYAYGGYNSTLHSNNTRNIIKNVQYGLNVAAEGYFHNDFNDFTNCYAGIFVHRGGYAGSNECTFTACDYAQMTSRGGTAQMDNADAFSGTTQRVHNLSSIVNNSGTVSGEFYKEGYFYPERGNRGAWAFGYNNLYDMKCAVSYCVSPSGNTTAQRVNASENGILVESPDTNIKYTFVNPANRGVYIDFIDEAGVRAKKTISAQDGQIQVHPNTSDFFRFSQTSFYASSSNYSLGQSDRLWKQVYASSSTISTSDERLKANITAFPDEVLDAWGNVNWYQFQMTDSLAEKGSNARLHSGVIAQRIKSAFESHGLDATRYGLLCYDEWGAEEEVVVDETVVQKGREAGNRWSVRYSEALAMEAAYQRRRADRIEERLSAIERKLNEQ